MKTYLDELTDEEKVRSRDPKECYKDGFSEEFTYAHRCSDRAIKYLENHQDEDFFLSVSYDCLLYTSFSTAYLKIPFNTDFRLLKSFRVISPLPVHD